MFLRRVQVDTRPRTLGEACFAPRNTGPRGAVGGGGAGVATATAVLRVRPKIGTAPPTVDQLVAARNGAAGAEGTLLSQGAGNPTGTAVLQVALQIDAGCIAGGETRRTGNRRADPILTTLARGASLAAAAAMGRIKARVGAGAVAKGGPHGTAARSVHAAALGGADIAAATAVGWVELHRDAQPAASQKPRRARCLRQTGVTATVLHRSIMARHIPVLTGVEHDISERITEVRRRTQVDRDIHLHIMKARDVRGRITEVQRHPQVDRNIHLCIVRGRDVRRRDAHVLSMNGRYDVRS